MAAAVALSVTALAGLSLRAGFWLLLLHTIDGDDSAEYAATVGLVIMACGFLASVMLALSHFGIKHALRGLVVSLPATEPS